MKANTDLAQLLSSAHAVECSCLTVCGPRCQHSKPSKAVTSSCAWQNKSCEVAASAQTAALAKKSMIQGRTKRGRTVLVRRSVAVAPLAPPLRTALCTSTSAV